MHLGRWGLATDALSVLVAFQVLLLWVKAQYFARWATLLHTTVAVLRLYPSSL